MKALGLALLAVLAVTVVVHRGSPQRTPMESKAWAGWFERHRDGGGV